MGLGSRQKIAGGTAVIMTVVMAAILANGGPGINFTCTSEYTDYFELKAAVNNTANSGTTMCVKADMGSEDPIRISAAMSADTRIIAFPPNGTLNAPTYVFEDGADNFTIEGFEFTNNTAVGLAEGTSNIRIVKNYFHDQVQDAIQASGSGAKTNISILGNRIKRITFDGEFPHGYGIYGANMEGVKINYNECDQGIEEEAPDSPPRGDCWEIAGSDNFEMIGNWVHNVKCWDCGQTHTDGYQFWSDSDNGVVKDNVVDGFAQNTISPDGDDVLFENNLVVDGQGNCHDEGVNGSSGDVQPTNHTIKNNTIWYCGFYGFRSGGADGTGGGNILEDNIIEDGACNIEGFVSAAGNVVRGDNWGGCPTSSDSNYMSGWIPNWNNTDLGNHPTYQATNLPLGYEGAGYQPAPYGPAACPC